MANYFVDPVNGDNTRNAATAQSVATPWKTLNKALTNIVPASGGDTVYCAPGIDRAVVSASITPDATHQITVIGDVTNSQGFANVNPGEYVLTNFTTNDTTASANSVTLQLAGKPYFTFQTITAIAGLNSAVGCSAGSTNVTFTGCLIISQNATVVSVASAADAASNYKFDQCIIVGMNAATFNIAPAAFTGGSDVDINFVIQNSLIFYAGNGGNNIGITPLAPGGAGKAYGIKIYNNTIIGGVRGVFVTTVNHSSSNASLVYNNNIIGCGTGIAATTSGQITEDYNVIGSAAARSNVTAGTNSKLSASASLTHSVMLEWGQSMWIGRNIRPFLTPLSGSPLLGFGNQSVSITADAWNRPRPAGGSSTSSGLGYLERHDTAAKETSITDAGGVGINLTGPADQDIRVPVDAASTTITVKYRSDANAAPTAQVLANSEIGVTASAVQTGTSSQGTFTTLTIPAFTPTAKGVVTLRLCSGATNGTGVAYFDTISVT